jgi:hypothetical protein
MLYVLHGKNGASFFKALKKTRQEDKALDFKGTTSEFRK